MYPATEQLYGALIGPPNPERWPESLRDRPVEAQPVRLSGGAPSGNAAGDGESFPGI